MTEKKQSTSQNSELSPDSIVSLPGSVLPPVQWVDDEWDDEDDDWDLLFDEQPLTPELKRERYEEQLMHYYADPETIAYFREHDGLDPIDPVEVQAWYDALPEDKRRDVDAYKQDKDRQRAQFDKSFGEVHDRLTATVPELYKARLPEGLEQELDGMHYAIGFNQSGTGSVRDATRYLTSEHGVDQTNYNPSQRFNIFESTAFTEEDSPDMTLEWAIERGYNGMTEIGRFVVVFPQAQTETISRESRFKDIFEVDSSVLPRDFYTHHQTKSGMHTVLSNKYVAGYIDGDGIFWANNNFMNSTEPDLRRFQPEPSDTV